MAWFDQNMRGDRKNNFAIWISVYNGNVCKVCSNYERIIKYIGKCKIKL